ncbi:uncharacterized protein LOC141649013 [Silene latifolia]|uniref:uncharacterized protein LOC141649013 n=1 Tax=Silene latifolia TaxID=37657 RepID=UPI003D78565F
MIDKGMDGEDVMIDDMIVSSNLGAERANYWKQAKEAGNTKWRPLDTGFWKVNVDAAILGSAVNGLGVVIRDEHGHVGRAAVKEVHQCWEPCIAEAKAALFSLQVVRQMGIDKVVLESDSLQLVTLLRNTLASYMGNMVRDIPSLARNFEVVCFDFVRSGNRVMHCLAHYFPIDYSPLIWVDIVPDCIGDVVAADFDFISTFD